MQDDLYRSAIKARLARLPQVPPWETTAPSADEDMDEDMEDDEEEDEDDDVVGDLRDMSISTPTSRRTAHGSSSSNPNAALSPLSAASHFSQALSLSLPSRGLDVRMYYTPPSTAKGKGSVLLAHHGAGSSALSFALLASAVKERSGGELGVLVFDCRGHGKTTSIARKEGSESGDLQLSLASLSDDLVALVTAVFPTPQDAPSLVLVGHSMGASVTLEALPSLLERKYTIIGTAVLDVVEGTAIEALPHMRALLLTRPPGFTSLEDAISWHITTNTIRNPTSARTSVAALFRPAPTSAPPGTPNFLWRAPLESTEPFWEGWFVALSNKFLSARTARLLVLAGTERLDRALMIGQMQGKFQLVVIPDTGHHLQEDAPERLAEVLVEFWRRNDRVMLGFKRVGEV